MPAAPSIVPAHSNKFDSDLGNADCRKMRDVGLHMDRATHDAWWGIHLKNNLLVEKVGNTSNRTYHKVHKLLAESITRL